MEAVKISVIVPIYKVEAFLEQCVRSICNQTHRNLEIILVDDGSPDNCGSLCDKLTKEDPRIRVIHQKNAGQSAARNAALNVMTGDYVGFVDSDDWIEPKMYETLLLLLQQHHAQIAACGMCTDRGISHNREYPQKSDIEVFSQTEALIEVTRNQKVTNSVCDKLWDKAVFDTVRFPSGEYFEDMKIVYKCLELIETVAYTPEPYYIYRMTEESTTRGRFQPRMFDDVYAAKIRAEYYQQKHPELYEYAFASYIQTSLVRIWDSRHALSCTEKRKEIITAMRQALPANAIEKLNFRNKVKLYALRMGLPVFSLVMKMNDCVKKK